LSGPFLARGLLPGWAHARRFIDVEGLNVKGFLPSGPKSWSKRRLS
jgi:hypothetical protein